MHHRRDRRRHDPLRQRPAPHLASWASQCPGNDQSAGKRRSGKTRNGSKCVDRVPTDVPVGLHLCYGDYGHEHFRQPESLRMQVDLLNAVVAAARRPVNWASFTVPQARADARYFGPLRDLAARPETELYFALVPYHPDDQPDGTTAAQVEHIDTALAASAAGRREWGICTECGMGRVAADDVPRLLDLHREILSV